MKKIFLIYWVFYSLLVLAYGNSDSFPLWFKTSLGAFFWLNLVFVLSAPLIAIIYGLGKPSKSDPKFLSMCLYAGMIRGFVCTFAYFGMTSQIYIWCISILGFIVYILLDRIFEFKDIHIDYFKY